MRKLWFGYVHCMESKRPKKMEEMEIKEKRPKGHPRTKWIQGLKKTVDE